ncbi:MAG: type II toxin-antitoxin system RelE/ParE family toxin [Shinella sp.]|nr:type II toxin-antitoxin system RelE/ParE family toxin [Shinella sp.]
MVVYLFYPLADAVQDNIWRQTAEKWGEAQAISYITGLHAHLERLSVTKAIWRRLPQHLSVPQDLKDNAYFSRYERHYIFFRELPNGMLGVMSILHERMDLPVRLAEDLRMIGSKFEE